MQILPWLLAQVERLNITLFQKGSFNTSCRREILSQLLKFFALFREGFNLCWGKLWILLLLHPTPYPTFISPGGMTKPSRSRQVSSTRLHAMPPIIHPSLLWLSPSRQHLLQNQPLSHTPSKLVFLSTSNGRAWITNRAYRPSLHSGQFVSLP